MVWQLLRPFPISTVRRSLCTAFPFLLILAATFANAAYGAPAARLTGRILDENGTPVPNVQISVTLESAGSTDAFTDAEGNFQINIVDVGKAHLRAAKAGFFEVKDRPFELIAGENEITLVLNHEKEIEEQVEVRSSSTQIDPEQTAHQESLVQHEILDTPVAGSHDLNNVLIAMPGVVEDTGDKIHVAGSRADQTEVVLDGFEINDPATNTYNSRVNVDAVRQASVQSGRYGAEYAHAGAGVLALDTAVGDDRFRAGVTNFIPGVSAQQGLHFGNWYPRVTFSGPIKRGRAWFSDGATVEHNFTLFKDLPRGANTTAQWASDNLLRGQINVTPHNQLQGSFLLNELDATNQGLGPFAPLSTTRDQRVHRSFVSAKDQIWLGHTLIEFGMAMDWGGSSLVPQGTLPYILTPTTASGDYFETVHARSHRLQVIGNVLAGSRHWHGLHDISAGVSADGLEVNQQAARTQIDTERVDATLADRTTFAGTASPRATNSQIGIYVQDAWHPEKRLVITGGVRMDWDRLTRGSIIGPRLAGNFLPFGTDRAKLTISWGRFYQPLDLSLFEMGSDQQRVDTYYDATGGVRISGPATSRFIAPAGLREPFFDTTSAGWEQHIWTASLLGANVIWRRGSNGLAYQDLTPGVTGSTYQLENGRRDRYRAAEVWFRHSFTDQAEIFFDYTRSSATSNQVLDPNLGMLFFVAQAGGAVPWDTPNRIISRGWTPTPLWHLFFSYFAEYRTGFPFNTVNTNQELIGAPDRLRYPAYFSLNLGLEKRFHFRGHEWAIRVSAINVTDHADPDSVINNVDAPNFLTFAGGQRRAFTSRLRLITRK
jgi:hypothetical protein